MSNEQRIGWATVLFLAALALGMALSATVHASALSFEERIAALVPSVASRREASVDAAELASAIADVSKGSPEWAALLLTLAHHETALSARIAGGGCRVDSRECDGGRAWGLLQVHRSTLNAAVWGSTDIRDQVREGSRIARGAFYMCKRAGVSFPIGVFRAMGGRGCYGTLPGEQQRLATFNRLRRRL
jgi:hypothetical protein